VSVSRLTTKLFFPPARDNRVPHSCMAGLLTAGLRRALAVPMLKRCDANEH
jgi:hypothetical protein